MSQHSRDAMESTMQWTRRYQIYFRDPRDPQAVRFQIEKRIRTLLKLQPGSRPLAYTGDYQSPYNGLTGPIDLRFEAWSLYSLSLDAARRRDYRGHLPPKPGSKFAEVGFLDEPAFVADSQKLFSSWTDGLTIVRDPGPVTAPQRDSYEHLVQAAVEADLLQQASREDEAPIAAVQQSILEGLRAGKQFVSFSHEGMLQIRMEGSDLVRRETGEQDSCDRYSTTPAMLQFLREYFDFQARRDTLPHKPPELEIWRFIARKFE